MPPRLVLENDDPTRTDSEWIVHVRAIVTEREKDKDRPVPDEDVQFRLYGEVKDMLQTDDAGRAAIEFRIPHPEIRGDAINVEASLVSGGRRSQRRIALPKATRIRPDKMKVEVIGRETDQYTVMIMIVAENGDPIDGIPVYIHDQYSRKVTSKKPTNEQGIVDPMPILTVKGERGEWIITVPGTNLEPERLTLLNTLISRRSPRASEYRPEVVEGEGLFKRLGRALKKGRDDAAKRIRRS